MKKVAVVLSGCGVFDGAEIYESTLTLLNLDRLDLPYQCLAPNIPQMHVINHLTGEVMEAESRNVLVEAARIARGEIQDLATAKAEDFSAVIFPGGFGAAKNLCNFAVKGPDCDVNPEVERFISEALQAKLPLGFICIAPALMGKVAQRAGIKTSLTLGTGAEWAEKIEAMGQTHAACPVREIVVDEANRMISTPAYMEAGRISEAADGIENLVKTLAAWLR
ncbi:isoprenoid biosynthesis protein ElbB [bacterium (Candidatus Blackallbacteria) CG17_big_fil_post_rev_8_21_14_2_50_48_46]|uniref:Isoprenoid biosynthesis protein ElbB n=1 Tax=bacterium (Candidatus Blackallbacteria) CG17_big_fil_post_rev_8_21_14_2_50_48_46 TaxID=2014261 RepID=A0A2M7G704_9BACT|nr:MAG: isoprenoid biosynthesis protein ElbB [bacterium (Candidatus Blackallbacteria) CG18_big_fil_WC_8_21_14_2_50_49_26]PIW17823.1 MAG: isoprenoid biosynthesis protein ElbB [bacterium (Candidatus Blackallbacteria) CG17_big_fil_post_rev_8_21_14_2_50_48_46]PIW48499.1 MAG: isoprenoid biosynthesis protein ElbB [bacterium (Candidatus Blackallbacteria) CG13_big_fil_rev_8_21_14_2_50_49_14]